MNAIYKMLPIAVAMVLTGCNGGAPKAENAAASNAGGGNAG
jgi:hypothetical protein